MTTGLIGGWDVLAGVGAAVVSALAGGLCRRLAVGWSLVDTPRDDRHASRSVPLGGGVSWMFALVAVLGVGAVWITGGGATPEILRPHLSGLALKLEPLLWILGGAVALMVLGFRDDRRPVPPGIKLSGQIIVASTVAWMVPDLRITVFIEWPWLSLLVTVIWIVFWTNAFNLLDHADGVATVTALGVLSGLALLSAETGQQFVGVFSIVMAGSLVGFLVHNLPPARLFMGDAGSLPLGYLIAVVTALFTFYSDQDPATVVLVPLCLLTVPLYDSLSVIVIRLWEHRPVWLGDRRHLTHRLIAAGWSDRRALAAVFLITFLGAGMAYLTLQLPVSWRAAPASGLLIFLLALGGIEARRS